MKLQDKVNDLFKTHPKVDTFYMTSDEQFFEQKANADAHAQKVRNRGVATINRDQVTIETEDKVEGLAGDGLLHQETTLPTEEEKAAKILADKTVQQVVNEALGSKATRSVDIPGSDVQLDNVPVDALDSEETESEIKVSTDASLLAEAANAPDTAAIVETETEKDVKTKVK